MTETPVQPDEWWTAEATPIGTPTPDPAAWTDAVIALGDLNEAERVLARAVVGGCQHQLETLGHGHVLTLVAALQDLRKALAQTEAYLIREVGRDDTFTAREGVLPDGRAYVVRKGQARKAWDHTAWKDDVRREVLSGVGEVVDTSTGEQVDLHALLAAVQDVHGAGAPKVTALRGLGLEVDAYCESVPGSWGLQVTGDTGEE